MIKTFKDFYGSRATIKEQNNGQFKLTIKTAQGKAEENKLYNTYRGARIAMGKCSDAWREVN